MNKDNEVMDNKVECGGGFFDWSCVDSGGGDVYYTFRGAICSQLKGGVNNVLYGKRVNLSEMYGEMVDDVSEYIIGGRLFLEGKVDKNGHVHMFGSVSKYTTAKYGISIGWVIGVIKNDMSGSTMDNIYGCMIERAGGVERIDWMRLYNNNRGFNTNRGDILLYIANRIIGDGGIYRYFVDRYKLKAVGVEVNNDGKRLIVLEWDGGRRLIPLHSLMWDKRDWWRRSTYDCKDRSNIRDYDVLLNGRREDEVLPDVCPIDNNIVLNYTRIDFSSDNDNNLSECKRYNEVDGDGDKIWSFASIDRIDSDREYSYDNVEVISQYYNAQVKNCASVMQTGKLYYYQLHRMISKRINKENVKTMSNSELNILLDDMGVYINLIEIVHSYRKILFKEIDRRCKIDKKRNKS